MKQLRLKYLDPSELEDNPANWRKHPDRQVKALEDVIDEVGWAGACLYNERTKRLVDGHLRKKIGKGKIPVLIGDWSEEQEKKILATLDPIAAMAEANTKALELLLRDVQTESESIANLLTQMASVHGIIEGDDPNAEWQGMPEFEQQDQSGIKAIVHFENEKDKKKFEKLVGQKIPDDTHSIWYPKKGKKNLQSMQYES